MVKLDKKSYKLEEKGKELTIEELLAQAEEELQNKIQVQKQAGIDASAGMVVMRPFAKRAMKSSVKKIFTFL